MLKATKKRERRDSVRVYFAAWRFVRALRRAKLRLRIGYDLHDQLRWTGLAMAEIGRLMNVLYLRGRIKWIAIAQTEKGVVFGGWTGDDAFYYDYLLRLAWALEHKHGEWRYHPIKDFQAKLRAEKQSVEKGRSKQHG